MIPPRSNMGVPGIASDAIAHPLPLLRNGEVGLPRVRHRIELGGDRLVSDGDQAFENRSAWQQDLPGDHPDSGTVEQDTRAVRVSIGIQTGPRIGVQLGPLSLLG